MRKHGTASVFVFARVQGEWRVALIAHPRLGRAMIPGGHVEDDETAAEAAWREVLEETGLRVHPVRAHPAELPPDYPHPVMEPAWWTTELPVPPDRHLAEDHVHVDHVFVAIADNPEPISDPEHAVTWWCRDELLSADAVFDDTKVLARYLFAWIEGHGGPSVDPAVT